jgi:hypothetical protein
METLEYLKGLKTDKESNKNNINKIKQNNYSEGNKNDEFLIPGGGTTDWMTICALNKNKNKGYKGKILYEIPISYDCSFTIENFKQYLFDLWNEPKEESFFTSVVFHKREVDDQSIYSSQKNESRYTFYYPYGSKFNVIMLMKIGKALNGLIDQARDLENIPENENKIQDIINKQTQLLDLFIDGTTDSLAVTKIMRSSALTKSNDENKDTRFPKEWLPYFSDARLKSIEEQNFDNIK